MVEIKSNNSICLKQWLNLLYVSIYRNKDTSPEFPRFNFNETNSEWNTIVFEGNSNKNYQYLIIYLSKEKNFHVIIICIEHVQIKKLLHDQVIINIVQKKDFILFKYVCSHVLSVFTNFADLWAVAYEVSFQFSLNKIKIRDFLLVQIINRNMRKKVWNMFKVNNNNSITTSLTSFRYFYC